MTEVFQMKTGKTYYVLPKSVGLRPSKLPGTKVPRWKWIKLLRRHPVLTRNILTENRSKKKVRLAPGAQKP